MTTAVAANKQIDLSSSRGNNTCRAAKANHLDNNEDYTSSSIIEFLNQERQQNDDENDNSDVDIESIFDEINRLSKTSDGDKSVDEILKEAEILLSIPIKLKSVNDETLFLKAGDTVTNKFQRLVLTEKTANLSEESTPREMRTNIASNVVEHPVQVQFFVRTFICVHCWWIIT